MKESNEKLSSIFSKISLLIVLGICVILIDIPTKLIPNIRISTGAYFLPFYLCPIAFLLSLISLKLKKSRLGYISLMLNIFIILLEIIFMIVGFKFLVH